MEHSNGLVHSVMVVVETSGNEPYWIPMISERVIGMATARSGEGPSFYGCLLFVPSGYRGCRISSSSDRSPAQWPEACGKPMPRACRIRLAVAPL